MTEAQTMLEPCPFCGKALHHKRGKINPNARCVTEDCYGAKMPVISLDVPSDVEAWNTRATTAAAQDGDEMDDFIRAVLADNNPRSDEPFATVAKWIRLIRLAYPVPEKASTLPRPQGNTP